MTVLPRGKIVAWPARRGTDGSQAGGDLLSARLGNRENNLDLVRIFAASLVILGHAYAIVGRGTEPMTAWNGRIFSGGFALNIFFFLSGLLVTNSFLMKPDIVLWYTSRALRIFPALLVCLILTVFALGTMATTLPARQYLKSHATWDYFTGNLLLQTTRYSLPGVFGGKPVNGTLWSLFLEVRLYLCFGVLLRIFSGKRREWLTAAILALAAIGLLNRSWVFTFGENDNNYVCTGLFLLGALCALWSDRIVPGGVWLAILFLAVNKYVYTDAFLPLFFFFSAAFVLYFGFAKWLLRVRLPGDYSYGLYIYGWPVSQGLALGFPQWRPEVNGAVSLCGTLALAALSWHLLEKRILGRRKALGLAIRLRLRWVSFALGTVALIATALYLVPPREKLRLVAFGPEEIVAGEKFNMQPDGVSAMWARLTEPLGPDSYVVFRGEILRHCAISGNLITASVPDALTAVPGTAEMYVVDRDRLPARRTPIARIRVTAARK